MPPSTLIGFMVNGARGVWYDRADVTTFVTAAEVDAYISERRMTAMQRNNATRGTDGNWRVGGPTTIYGDKFVRSQWPDLPYARKCVRCLIIKGLDDFAAAMKQNGFVQKRATCRVCERSPRSEDPVTSAATLEFRTCNVCLVNKPLGQFYRTRASCHICLNSRHMDRVIAKVKADSGV